MMKLTYDKIFQLASFILFIEKVINIIENHMKNQLLQYYHHIHHHQKHL